MVFRVSWKKNICHGKMYHSFVHFMLKRVKSNTHGPDIFSVFQMSVVAHCTFANGSVICSMSNAGYTVPWTTKTLPHPSPGALLFGLLLYCCKKWERLLWLLLSPNHRADCRQGEPDFFTMSAHFHFGSLFTAAKSQVSCLLTIGFTSSRSWFRAIHNGKPAGVVVANCFCNFYHI